MSIKKDFLYAYVGFLLAIQSPVTLWADKDVWPSTIKIVAALISGLAGAGLALKAARSTPEASDAPQPPPETPVEPPKV